MPNPISLVRPNASIIIANAGGRILSQRPQLAVLVAEAINSWCNVEAFLLRLFVQLFGGNNSLAARIYLSFEIQSAKTAALAEAVKSIPDPALQGLMRAVIAISKTNQKHRNKLVHHVWGISPELSDALLLADPKISLTEGNINRDDIFVYTADDLNNIIEANDRLCGFGTELLFILNDHPANRGNRLFLRLCEQPEIRERLARQQPHEE